MYRRTCDACLQCRHCDEHRVNIYLKVREPEWLRRMRERGLPAKDMTAAR